MVASHERGRDGMASARIASLHRLNEQLVIERDAARKENQALRQLVDAHEGFLDVIAWGDKYDTAAFSAAAGVAMGLIHARRADLTSLIPSRPAGDANA